ncbi:YfbU family protein [Paenibacillus jamilae]|uniref:YfbU family protein n=1 Tax=Paenibacillus jamilae TaxID=114136 RepID=UPI003D28B8B6
MLKELNPSDRDYYDPKIEILENGYTPYYDEILGMVQEDLPEHVSNEVFSILNLYRAIHSSYSELDDVEKSDFKETDIRFKGFDMNEEYDHYSFAKYVVEGYLIYQDLQNKSGYNTHRNTLYKYGQMLQVWNELDKKTNLSKDEIKRILSQ